MPYTAHDANALHNTRDEESFGKFRDLIIPKLQHGELSLLSSYLPPTRPQATRSGMKAHFFPPRKLPHHRGIANGVALRRAAIRGFRFSNSCQSH